MNRARGGACSAPATSQALCWLKKMLNKGGTCWYIHIYMKVKGKDKEYEGIG